MYITRTKSEQSKNLSLSFCLSVSQLLGIISLTEICKQVVCVLETEDKVPSHLDGYLSIDLLKLRDQRILCQLKSIWIIDLFLWFLLQWSLECLK